jgi:hypothetical protein
LKLQLGPILGKHSDDYDDDDDNDGDYEFINYLLKDDILIEDIAYRRIKFMDIHGW